jgi:hypothetical protein
MRVSFGCILLVLSALGMAFGQDTNFATGPQYLMNYGSPLFARSIVTPSLSLTSPPLEVGSSNATQGLTAGAENQTASLAQPNSLPAVDLFTIYYGAAPASVIEISFPKASGSSSSPELPASFSENGVWQMTAAQTLRERGYGVTLPEAAAYSKEHAGHATHVYTNSDLDRLHGVS